MSQKLTKAIAGATGFIGKALREKLQGKYHVVALSRSLRTGSPDMTWRQCDLYSLESCVKALKGVDKVVYLVHSMMPSARLTQARFEDLDLILADNFARACKENGIDHAIYVGGLDPETPDTSVHLHSRMEVEQVLDKWISNVTALRAGLVIGEGGSSFDILYRVAHRLPVLLCPKWMRSKLQPIALEDVLHIILHVLSMPNPPTGCHDIGGPEIMTYRSLLEKSIQLLGLKRILINIPLSVTKLSSLGVGVITGTSQSLVYPLIQSLKHDMITKNTSLQDSCLETMKNFEEAFLSAIPKEQVSQKRKGFSVTRFQTIKKVSSVRSIQRMQLPKDKDAIWVAEEYIRWLPKAFGLIVQTEKMEGLCRMYLRGSKYLLLELRFLPEQSNADLSRYAISGGLLLRGGQENKGTFEFRVVLDQKVVLAAIHDFYPSLPWYIYTFSQAKVHLLVMQSFCRHINKISNEQSQ